MNTGLNHRLPRGLTTGHGCSRLRLCGIFRTDLCRRGVAYLIGRTQQSVRYRASWGPSNYLLDEERSGLVISDSRSGLKSITSPRPVCQDLVRKIQHCLIRAKTDVLLIHLIWIPHWPPRTQLCRQPHKIRLHTPYP
ncbi:hypothetical protein Hamer_G016067 [Homarus americanus]|uniref:Uncharacterized protein n=1 Tax=Homarus americanus TaxID=6706 RepID=A0A8J5JDM6_HOMAM|nr:hypothetical protein Hamer_G016067 [Homarus americanus]